MALISLPGLRLGAGVRPVSRGSSAITSISSAIWRWITSASHKRWITARTAVLVRGMAPMILQLRSTRCLTVNKVRARLVDRAIVDRPTRFFASGTHFVTRAAVSPIVGPLS